MSKLIYSIVALSLLSSCKYYGSALPPEYPLSMDNALTIANDKNTGPGGAKRQIIKKPYRPQISRPAYIPEKELAVIAPPKTLLVWTYPHITSDNTRVFGNWSTIFLTDKYEWVLPANEVSVEGENTGGNYGVLK